MYRKVGSLLILFFLLLVGGMFVVSNEAYAQDFINGERIAGSDRYLTSIDISKKGWPNEGSSSIAVIATGQDFPDALCAAPLAKKHNAPILLTDSISLSPELKGELKRLGVSKVYIIGGTGVVSKNIENSIKNMGINCVRLSGMDRYGTSVEVAKEMDNTDKMVIATGEDFPDALSIAPWAAAKGIPILLTGPESLPDNVDNYLKTKVTTYTYVVGGTGVVSDKVVSKLQNPERIFGNDRYATNAAVLNTFRNDFGFDKVFVATGDDFPDALAGSALAALSNSAVVLSGNGQLTSSKAFVDTVKNEIDEVVILGGEGAVSNTAVASVAPPTFLGIQISLPKGTILLDKTAKASVNVMTIPRSAIKPSIIYSTDNPEIATIDSDGIVTGIGKGTTTIRAEVGGKTDSLEISVRENALVVLDPGHGGSSPGAVPLSQNGRNKLVDRREAILNMEIAEKLRQRLEDSGFEVVMTREGDDYVSLEERAEIANNLEADVFISIHHDSATSRYANGTSAYYSSYKPGISSETLYVYAFKAGPVYDMNGRVVGNLKAGNMYDYIETSIDEKGEPYLFFYFNGSLVKVSEKADYITVRNAAKTEIAEESRQLAVLINNGISSLGLASKGVVENNFAVNRYSNIPSVLVEVGFISNWDEFSTISADSFQEKVAEKIAQAVIEMYK